MSKAESKVKNIFDLTPMQEGMLFHSLMNEDSNAYIEVTDITIVGKLKVDVLQETFQELVDRHDILKTVFLHKKTQKPRQVVLNERSVEVHFEDLTKNINSSELSNDFLSKEKKRQFNLSKDSLLRLNVLKIKEDKYRIIWSFHHIIMDGWCMGILMDEFFQIYSARLKNVKPSLLEPVPFGEYLKWLAKQNKEEAESFWKKYLESVEYITSLPSQSIVVKSYQKKDLNLRFNETKTAKIKAVCDEKGVSINNFIQTVWALFLQKLNNTNEVTFGTVVSGRPPEIPNVESILGLFINTIPVHVKIELEKSFESLLEETKLSFNQTKKYDYFPLPEILNQTSYKQDLFDHILVFENFPVEDATENVESSTGLKVEKIESFEETSYDFNVFVFPENELTIKFNYNASKYSTVDVELLRDRFIQLVDSVLDQPKISLSKLTLLTKEEKNELLSDLTGSVGHFTEDTLVTCSEVFKEKEDSAIIFGDEEISYSLLVSKSDALAHILIDKGIEVGDIIGINQSRGIDYIISMLAIMKVGAAFVPIDTNYPLERQNYLLLDSKAKMVITDKDNVENSLNIKKLDLTGQPNSINKSKPNDLAYIIYTSGSTGNPKGVAIEHRNAVSMINWAQEEFKNDAYNVVFAGTSFSFDLSIFEIFFHLSIGIKIRLLNSGLEINNFLTKEDSILLNTVPSVINDLQNINADFSNVVSINMAGEPIPIQVKDKLDFQNIKVRNLYGPSEDTTYSTIFRLTVSESKQNIGKAIYGTKAYVLNDNLELLPKKVPGELYLSGTGVTRGYLYKDDLTNERFINNPYHPGERLYKTGDLVRWDENWDLEYLGRIDNQVKIRGHRIELGEIETTFTKIFNFKAATVIAKTINGEQQLCAYLVGEDFNIDELKSELAIHLPMYMVPMYLIKLDELPLTPNGKIDKKNLPEPLVRLEDSTKSRPTTENELKLSQIWQNILNIDQVYLDDNFFNLGGHSLKATVLISLVQKEFNVEFPISKVFDLAIFKDQLTYIEQSDTSPYEAIKNVGQRAYYPLSAAQKRMYLLNEIENNSTAYNLSGAVLIKGDLDVSKVENAISRLIIRHESLRTTFDIKNKEIVQIIHDDIALPLSFKTITNTSIEEEINVLNIPFNLNKGSLFKIAVFDIENDTSKVIAFILHHIISDGISIEIMIEEFLAFYNDTILEPLKLQYKDYSVWQSEFQSTSKYKDQESFLINQFSGEIPVLELNTDFPRPNIKDFSGSRKELTINKEHSEKINAFCIENKITPFTFFNASISLLLSKNSGQEDIILGSPIAGRPHADLQSIIGVFVNTLLLRNNVDPYLSIDEYLKNVSNSSLKSIENQDYPFDILVEKLNLTRSLNRNPLFDVMIAFQNMDKATVDSGALVFESLSSEETSAKFDLTFFINEFQGEYTISLQYATSLFRESTVSNYLKQLDYILNLFLKNTKERLGNIDILLEEEKSALNQINTTKTDFAQFNSVLELMPKTNETALLFNNHNIKYSDLEKQSNQFANYLISEFKVKNGNKISILLDRSEKMIIVILGILKAGATYVPIDPTLPIERINFIINDSESILCVSDKNVTDSVINLNINETWIDILNASTSIPTISISNENEAYLIYTSGSTGNPKGCVLTHANLLHYIQWANSYYFKESEGDFPLYTSISFDLTITSIFSALTRGRKIKIYDQKQDISDVLKDMFSSADVDFVKITPAHISLLKSLSIKSETIKGAIVGGDQLTLDNVQVLRDIYPEIRIYNEYGPTEVTVGCVVKEIDFNPKEITIGKPIANIEVHVLDKFLKQVPFGVKGELYLSGKGLAKEYLNRIDLTKERFIEGWNDKRIYKTGDIVSINSEGDLIYHGRNDFQLKIRGYRIELGEIENHLLAINEIIETTVVAINSSQEDTLLVAYYTASQELDNQELIAKLGNKLPDYMLPNVFMKIDRIPLTNNGKVDKKALPKPILESKNEYQAPSTQTEKLLVGLWESSLMAKKIGVNDNYFSLGGHSLKATILISEIERKLNKRMDLRTFFSNPSIREQAVYLDSVSQTAYSKIKRIEKADVYDVSPSQKRLWVLDQIHGGTIEYNMPALYHFEEKVNSEQLQLAFQKLIDRHEVLRTNFINENGTPKQKIHEHLNFNLKYVDFSSSNDIDKEIKFIYDSESEYKFDLIEDTLLRATLIKENDSSYYLVFVMHHIISDGWSIDILQRDLLDFYHNKEVRNLEIQYKDYAAWQNELVHSEDFVEHKNYWNQTLNGELPITELTKDFRNQFNSLNTGSKYTFYLDEKTAKSVNALCLSNNVSHFMFLLSVFKILIYKVTQNDDIIIGTPVAGREKSELKDLIGFFLNTVVLRNSIEEFASFKNFLNKVKNNTLLALEHQNYPFEQLVDDLNITRDINSFPITSIFFNMLNTGEKGGEIDDFNSTLDIHNHKIKFDIDFYATEFENTIKFDIDFKNELYENETIKVFAEKFVQIIDAVVSDENVPLYKIKTNTLRPLARNDKNRAKWYNKESSIIDRYLDVVEKNPNNIAVKYEGQNISYHELNKYVNGIAHELSLKSVSKVGVFVGHNVNIAKAILGTLRLGKVYVNLDPEYPVDRNCFVIDESKLNVILVDNTTIIQAKEQFVNVDFVNVDEVEKVNTFEYQADSNSEDDAYILYTSGSTGRPKGVVQTHGAVMHFISAYSFELNISDKDVLTGFSSPSFDSFNNDFYGAILNGATYCPISLKKDISILNLRNWLVENQITFYHSVPTVFRAFGQYLKSTNEKLNDLRIVKMTGEPTKSSDFDLFNEISNSNTTFVVSYGSTESTLNTIKCYKKGGKISKSILTPGQAIVDTIIVIFNSKNEIIDTLEIGEIAIRSEYTTAGYFNDGTLNKNAFVNLEGGRYYKTGDLGRILANGELEIIGRSDNQLKIRGVRVELAEIEKSITDFESILQCVVRVIKDESGLEQVVAYYIADKSVDKSRLRKSLTQKLPDYFIPTYYVQLDEFPLTPNGKIARNNLPEPEQKQVAISSEYKKAQNLIQEQIVELWQEVLEQDRIGVLDNFFELGGHSLKATAFVARYFKKYNVNIPLQELFKNPTIESLAEHIENKEQNVYSEIKKYDIKEYYPLTSSQKRLFVLNQFDVEGTSYNMPAANHIYGILDVEKIKKVFNQLVNRHDGLRTQFVIIGEEIQQQILSNYDFEVEFQERNLEEIDDVISEFIRPFDLAKAPLFRIGLTKFSENHYLLLFDMHHIVSDGRSLQVITEEFIKLYGEEELNPLKIQYSDYALWQQEFYDKPEIKSQEEFWLEELQNDIPVLELPYDYSRPEFISNKGTRYSFSLSKEESAKLKFLGSRQGATAFMTLFAIYNVLIHKYSESQDIVVGSPIAGRPDIDLENIIGMFVNTLAIRTQPNEFKSFSTYLSEVKVKAIECYDNQFFSFETIVEKLKLSRDTSRNPVFDTMFVLQNPPELKSKMTDELNFVYHQQVNRTSKFDISWIGYQGSDNFDFDIEYCTDLFKESTIKEFALSFKSIVKQVINNPEISISEINVLSDQLKNQIITKRTDLIDHKIVRSTSQIIDDIAIIQPNEIAVTFDDKNYTFKELIEFSNGYAKSLTGIRNKRIGVILEKSEQLIFAILGILKSGNSYVPIDVNAPIKRINIIVESAEIETVICDKSFTESINATKTFIEDIKPIQDQIQNLSDLNSEAYVIYTSGSTGKPKGVSIGHLAFIDKLLTKTKIYNWDKELTSVLTSSYTFDASILEIFPPLINGKKLVIPNANKMYDFEYLFNLIKKEKVTVVQGTTSYFKTFNESIKNIDKSGTSLKDFCIGGESLTKDIVNELRMAFPSVKINNHYGPTEATVDAIIKQNIKTFDKNIIGKPLPNVRIYILNEHLSLVPDGVKGEICIGGITLANGYVNDPENTAKSFIDNPFENGAKLYKTGDLGKWTKTGEIEFLGRKDTQVKVRGYRVELDEIRNVILQNNYISNCVVNAQPNKQGDAELVAYIVCRDKVDTKVLREYLLEYLPNYMIPSYFMELKEIPLTKSGKINYKGLPEPKLEGFSTSDHQILPTTSIEKEISLIWEDILNVENITIDDNFFELGGHSLKATQVVSRIQKELNYQLNLKHFFKYPSIRTLASFLSKNSEVFKNIPKAPLMDNYPLSNPQKRLWLVDQIGDNKSIYNMPGSFVFEGVLDAKVLSQSFEILIARQDSLRTIFINIDGDPRQVVKEQINFKIDFEDLTKIENAERKAKEIAQSHASIPFELDKGPLVRAILIKLEEDKHVFVLTMHHIISDGWSLEVMINELTIIYKALTQKKKVELKPLSIQYTDFTIYQNERIVKEDEDYWMQKLSGEIGLINLPYDYPQNIGGEAKGEQENIFISGEIVDGLKELSKVHQTTLSNVVLSVFNILLSQLSGQSNILIGMTSANRNHPDIEDLVGFFVNSLVIRTDLSGDLVIGDLIEQVKKNTEEAFEHGNYPFDMLVEKLSPERFANQQPLVNVTYSFQNLNDIRFGNEDLNKDWEETNDLKVSLFNFGEGTGTSKFDLLLFVNEVGEGLDFKFEYNSNLFNRKSIQKYLTFFKKFLTMVIQKPEEA